TSAEPDIAQPPPARPGPPLVLSPFPAPSRSEAPQAPPQSAASGVGSTVPAGLQPMDRSVRIVQRGYEYATPSDRTDGLALLSVGMTVHVEGKVLGGKWYLISGGPLKRRGYAKAAVLGL